MIVAVAFCPHPPLLVPQIGAGVGVEADELRAACADAVDRLVSASAAQLLILGADGVDRGLHRYAPGAVDVPDYPRLPLSVAIGSWLVDRAVGTAAARPPVLVVTVRPDGSPTVPLPDLSEPTALLVMGDGSARRSVKGPGYLDPRAEPFDDLVMDALATADLDALANLDAALATELLVAGVGPWRAVGSLLAGPNGSPRWKPDVRYAAAPFGVQYTVASWSPA
jgi:hypothetical protein